MSEEMNSCVRVRTSSVVDVEVESEAINHSDELFATNSRGWKLLRRGC